MSNLQNVMDEAFNEITKKRLSYEEWCIKKDTEKKLKKKLIHDTKIELHNELAKTLEDALQRKRQGDQVVSEWIKVRNFMLHFSHLRRKQKIPNALNEKVHVKRSISNT